MLDDPWQKRLTPEEAGGLLRQAWEAGTLSPEEPAVVFHDLDLLGRRLATLKALFPANALHAVAIKANPLVGVLRACVGAGAGLEAASMEEVELALAAGCPPEHIVFDSPVKTVAELRRSLELGLILNADNAHELERLATLGAPGQATVGLRINPVVGSGAISATSVADRGSKFGLPMYPDPAPILELFRRYPWLRGLHVHVGSQGCGVELMLEGVRRAAALAGDLGGLDYLDIGGGVPARYFETDQVLTMAQYTRELKASLPHLFEPGAPRLLTEFGRSLQAGCGFALARVEYVKLHDEHRIAVVHLGGDFMVRTVYVPDVWRFELAVLDAQGHPRSGPTSTWSVGGPLCFHGDFIARHRELPEMQPGDWVMIREAGAYTLAQWSRFCSRSLPTVLGRASGRLQVLRRRESSADVVAFWSP